MQHERMLAWIPSTRDWSRVSRRRFLAGAGLVAGAAALGPALRALAPAVASRVDEGRPMLGTWVRVVARHRDRETASRAVRGAFAAIARVDREMSVHRADSDLARVNRLAGSEDAAVPGSVVEVVRMARDAARRSGGLYDPTVLPLLRLYGFSGAERASWPSDREIARALDAVDWSGIAIDEERGRVGLARANAGIDLGSIGKGWAVDRAVEALRGAGVEHGMVDAGGNIAAFGAADETGDGWSVGVLHPSERTVSRVFVLRDAAIATSGNAEQTHELGGRRVGHLLDARRGRPAEGPQSVTVLARNGVEADVLSTAAFLLGRERFDWSEALGVHWIG